jgi:4-amino-4-deoxy-L-arabinose transferase-like glycosyltransferase
VPVQQAQGRKTWQRVILVAVALLLGLPTLVYPRMGSDTSTFTYIAQTIVKGGMPYRDAWDLKAPALFYVYAVPVGLFGKSNVARQGFDVLWQLATAMVLFAIAVRISKRREIGLLAGVLYLLLYYSQSYPSMCQAEGFLVLPLSLSFLWLLRALEDNRSLTWCIAGIWVAGATLFKLPIGLIGVVMIAAAVTQGRPGWSGSLRRLSALALGFAAPLLLCVIYFQVRGALWDLLTTLLIAGPHHALLNIGSYLEYMRKGLLPPVRWPFYALLLLGLVPLCFSVVRKQTVPLSTKLLAGWFLVGLVVLFMHGEFYAYHFPPMFAPLAILGAGTLYSAYAPGTRRKATWWLASAALLFIVSSAAFKFTKNVAYEWRTLHGERPATNNLDNWYVVSAYLRKHTSPEDRIFVWGNRPAIYVDTDLKSASRFVDAYHLALPPKGLDYRGIFLREFQATMPKYFIIYMLPGADWKESFQKFVPLRTMIGEDYQLESAGDLGPFELYRRKQ